ncbi:MAG: glycosyltransferase family 2 protein [Deltaproteobacteria bacterium]|nr:glycosyltransferase family 2 protein [Deltaproteobacteria bacterium]
MNHRIAKKNNKNLVSVIICFLDAKKFLREAIESVFAQTYNNWELLLIDDGSTDGSSDIARRYAKKRPKKVTYLDHDNHKNLGLSPSRNLGIKKSKGEYIAFLDADDIWLPKKLKQQVAIMNAHPKAAMVYGPALFWFSWTNKPGDKKRDFLQTLRIKNEEYNTMLKPPVLLRKWVKHMKMEPGTTGLMARRKAVNRVGGFEESFPNMMEDQTFYFKLFAEERVLVTKHIWYLYRQHPNSICRLTEKQKYYTISLRFWKWVKKYLANKEIKDAEIQPMIDERIRKYRRLSAGLGRY